MRILYNIGIRLYGFSIFIASFFNAKAAKWRKGRKDIFVKLKQAVGESTEPLTWFHCASLGEFEQGRPVIEEFRRKFPNHKILLTFFSPSGYEVRKDYKEADYVFYLPLDTPFNAKKFIETVKPSLALFVKYEFWFNYLNELHTARIPAFLISAKFREDQYFFKNTGAWFRKSLHYYTTLFVQDEGSESLLKKFGIINVIVSGDTRFDRVINISHQAFSDSVVQSFKNQHSIWICGSTWEEDERLISPVFERLIHQGQNLKLIIAPHDVSEARINNIQNKYPASIRYSQAPESNTASANMLIIDKIGLLSYLYRYADIAYVGGGFGKGIHNLTEAAVYGIPVLFGPNHSKFNEAEELIKRGAGFSISTEEELNSKITKLLSDATYRMNCGKLGASYIQSGKGATEKIISELEKVVSVST
jgi:3-deoxy-D-manno-octulosonic-acid transferase